VFDRWSVVPGDPLDTSVRLTNLEPASANALARDFVLKTRRRKGLAEEGMGVRKYLEKEVIESLMMEGDWEEVNDV
jgi:U5 small nuclear ribonucleoprotein component